MFTAERKPIKAALSFIVLVILFSTVGGFWRALTGSTLASLIFSFGTYTALIALTFLGDISPFGSMQIADENVFMLNKIVSVGAAAVLIAASYFILKRKDRLAFASV